MDRNVAALLAAVLAALLALPAPVQPAVPDIPRATVGPWLPFPDRTPVPSDGRWELPYPPPIAGAAGSAHVAVRWDGPTLVATWSGPEGARLRWADAAWTRQGATRIPSWPPPWDAGDVPGVGERVWVEDATGVVVAEAWVPGRAPPVYALALPTVFR